MTQDDRIEAAAKAIAKLDKNFPDWFEPHIETAKAALAAADAVAPADVLGAEELYESFWKDLRSKGGAGSVTIDRIKSRDTALLAKTNTEKQRLIDILKMAYNMLKGLETSQELKLHPGTHREIKQALDAEEG